MLEATAILIAALCQGQVTESLYKGETCVLFYLEKNPKTPADLKKIIEADHAKNKR